MAAKKKILKKTKRAYNRKAPLKVKKSNFASDVISVMGSLKTAIGSLHEDLTTLTERVTQLESTMKEGGLVHKETPSEALGAREVPTELAKLALAASATPAADAPTLPTEAVVVVLPPQITQF